MKLHPFDVQCLVTQAHDLIDRAVLQLGPGGQLQAFGQGFALDHQRVITGHRHGQVQAMKHTQILMEHRAGLAMHDLARPYHVTAKRLADGLMAQAYAQDRQLAGEIADGFKRDARFGRRARAWRNHDTLRIQGGNFGDGQFIVAHDLDLGTELAKVLHNVVGKGVVVINHQQHVGFKPLEFTDFK